MKKLSVLVALIMAITVFWIPGQSVFAIENEEDVGEPTVQAMAESHTVTFYDGEGEDAKVLKEETVEEGRDATPPDVQKKDGFDFKGWKGDYTNVTEDRSIYAQWEPEEQEPVEPIFDPGTITKGQNALIFNWSWSEGEGTTSVVINLHRYVYDRTGYYYYDKTITNGTTFTGLSDGTDYYYTITATVNGKKETHTGWVRTNPAIRNGWLVTRSGKLYYVNGVKLRATTTKIGKLNHYFDSYGVFRGRSSYMYSRVKSLSSKKYLICVDRTNNVTCVYAGGKNNWQPVQYWSCVTGRMRSGDYHPTPLGVYKVKSKKKTFSGYGIPEKKKNRYSVWHCTRFVGSVFFHSQLYKYKSKSSFIPGGAVMGVNASHGCIRLHKANAYWIYKNCAKGTTVVVIQ